MSAIMGILQFQQNQTLEQGYQLLKAYDQFPFDYTETWKNENVFFGCHAQRITPESIHERLPFYDYERKLAITADAIIDNREELFERLKVAYGDRKTITDSELILRAYLKWGKHTPNYLLGDFAFMIWDERKQTLFGARDFSGARTLYYFKNDVYFAFSTIIEPLFRMPLIEKRLNEAWLAEFLVIPTIVESADVHHTPYEKIYQLPPAHSLLIKSGNVSIERYWQLGSIEPLRLKNDWEYQEAFYDVFNRAVKERIRTDGIVGSHLSGGLDSGSVVSFAAEALREENKQLHTFSYIPEEDFTDWTPAYYIANEKSFIEETVRYVGNVIPHYLDFRGKDPYSEVDDFLEIMEMPYKFFENSFWLKGINEVAHRQEVKILLNGSRGNHSISWGTWQLNLDYYSTLLKRMRFIHLNQELNQYCRNFRTGKRIMLPIIAKNTFNRLVSKGDDPDKSLSMIHPDFAYKTDVYERLQQLGMNGNYGSDLNRYRKQHYNEPYFWNKSGTATTKLSLRYALWDRDPTNDLRVILFCLSLPEEQYVKAGMERSFLRRATKNILPDKVRYNHRIRGIQGADTIHRMKRHWQAFLSELQKMKNDCVLTEFIHREVLENALAKIDNEPDPSLIWKNEFKILTRSYIVQRFLQKNFVMEEVK
ncbi:asparagine synthase-related protein [Bacillus niameyensis]|uniref:asparagine synthase-related protein n=1 Tax=Bacillus niameyensis TaxID=1522308 RepID=UPI00078154B7|nr:asparagine synthase-related protein [Bacillus niameyensis]